jgi:hypothetical protein
VIGVAYLYIDTLCSSIFQRDDDDVETVLCTYMFTLALKAAWHI